MILCLTVSLVAVVAFIFCVVMVNLIERKIEVSEPKLDFDPTERN